MNKKFLFITVFSLLIFSIISIDVESQGECNTASFCNGQYELTCATTKDGYCPEYFGNWSSCTPNSCVPCDEDCELCGSISMTDLPSCQLPGSNGPAITVTASFNSRADTSQYILYLLKGTNPNPIANHQCGVNDYSCSETFTNTGTLPNSGGTDYSYNATTNHWQDNPLGNIIKTSFTAPTITIQNPSDGSNVNGVVEIIIDANSAKGISLVEVYMKKWNQNFGEFRPVYLQDDNGDCSLRCEGADCNRLGEATYDAGNNDYRITWDTTKCDNKRFEITASAYDNSLENCFNSDAIEVTTNNPDAPCIDQCPEERVGIFRFLIAKIKTFI